METVPRSCSHDRVFNPAAISINTDGAWSTDSTITRILYEYGGVRLEYSLEGPFRWGTLAVAKERAKVYIDGQLEWSNWV